MEKLPEKPLLAALIITALVSVAMTLMYFLIPKGESPQGESLGGHPVTEAQLLSAIELYQETNKGARYTFLDWTEQGDYYYTVHEYNGPDGIGYKAWVRRLNTDGHLEEKHVEYTAEFGLTTAYDWTVMRYKSATSTLLVTDAANL